MKHLLLFSILQLAIIFTSLAQNKIDYTDGFPIPGKFLITNRGMNIYDFHTSGDEAWFKNKELNASLIVSLGVDTFVYGFLLFNSDITDTVFTKQIQLYMDATSAYSAFNDEVKLIAFKMFVDSSKEIDAKYFTSNQGISLGMNKEVLIKKLKKPDNILKIKGWEIYNWFYKYTNKESAELVSEGVYITMYFKLNRLFAITIFL